MFLEVKNAVRTFLTHHILIYALLTKPEVKMAGYVRCGFIPISTVLQKSVRFFIKNIFFNTSKSQVEISKMVWIISCLAELLRSPGKGTLQS